MISPQFRPILGGYEMAAERLSQALAERGHRVMVISERRQPHWPRQESYGKITINRWWCIYRKGVHMMTSLFGLSFWLLKNGRKFEVWHVHQYGVHAALTIFLGRFLRRRLVLKLTSSGQQGLEVTLASGKMPSLMKFLHHQFDAIFVTTRETAAEAVAFGFKQGSIKLLGNGVDINVFRPRTENEKQLMKDKLGLTKNRTVVFVGRLSKEKNISGLLHSWHQAYSASLEDWKLVIVGDGPERRELENNAMKLNIADSVLFVGMQTNVSEWLGASDVYVLSSFNEGLSNTLLEAMASGLPAVVTSVSGSVELIKETESGFVVEVNDTLSYSNALLTLFKSEPLRQRMGSNARKVIESKYSLSFVAAEYDLVYSDLQSQQAILNTKRLYSCVV